MIKCARILLRGEQERASNHDAVMTPIEAVREERELDRKNRTAVASFKKFLASTMRLPPRVSHRIVLCTHTSCWNGPD